MWVRSVRFLVVEAPQSGLMQRHLVVPFVVVPFFFICPVHTGHRGRFLDMKMNQTARASTSTVQNLGLVEIYPDILESVRLFVCGGLGLQVVRESVGVSHG
ncbi:hypothetical protein CIP107524_00196 [Corynebacterium diphtheriae]|nr:hypothetical protein CIP107524_00196 [Corynebacterium diphtheriae]